MPDMAGAAMTYPSAQVAPWPAPGLAGAPQGHGAPGIGAGPGPGLGSAEQSAPPASSMSLFELPVSRRARWARILAVLALDVVLLAAGIAMIISYLHARERAQATPPRATAPGMAEVQVLPPTRPTQVTHGAAPEAEAPAASATEHSGLEQARSSQSHTSRAKPSAASPGRDSASQDKEERGGERDGDTGQEVMDKGQDPGRSGQASAGDEAPGRGMAPSASGTVAPGEVVGKPGAEPARGQTQEPAQEPAQEPSGADIDRVTREISLIVSRNTALLQRCHQQAARTSTPASPLEGRLDIHLEITPSGRTSNVYPVNNTTSSEPLARCVTGLFESWTFPEPPLGKSLELVWPLRFKAPK